MFWCLWWYVLYIADVCARTQVDIVTKDTHDPGLVRRSSDGTYYRFATGGLIPIYSAPSIQGPWKRLGTVLSGAAKVNNPGNRGLWVSHLVLLILAGVRIWKA